MESCRVTKTAIKPAASLPAVNNSQFRKLLRQWAWKESDGENGKTNYRKFAVLIEVDASGHSYPSQADLQKAAEYENLPVKDWVKGPTRKQKAKTDQLTDDDLTFFINARDVAAGQPQHDRFQEVWDQLRHQGLLSSYMKVREQVQSEPAKTKPVPAPPVTDFKPLELKADNEGYTSLTEALALRSLKKNELSRTACEIIATLSLEDVEDSSGKATRRLHERLCSTNTGEPLKLTAITMQLKDWENAGLIWREVNGKRCYKIGLSMPVKLTDDEHSEYVYNWKGVAPEPTVQEEEPEPIKPELPPVPMETDWLQVAEPSMRPAIEVLERELEAARLRVAGLEHALVVLTGQGWGTHGS